MSSEVALGVEDPCSARLVIGPRLADNAVMKHTNLPATSAAALRPVVRRDRLLVAMTLVCSGLLCVGLLAGCANSANGRHTAKPGVPTAMVADADGAMAALTNSPRHGEWVDVAVAGGSDSVRCWVVYPERPDPAPVVVVIHEIMGLSDWIRAVADGLAAEGCIAIAPDLLSGKGPDGGGSESFAGDAVRTAIRGLDRAEVNARLDAARTYALAQPAAGDASSCVGFCWGGATAFAYATVQPAIGGAIVYYGTAPDAERLATIACPILGFYGGDDARVTSTVEDTTAAMQARGKDYRPRVFAGAGHGFLRQQRERNGANLTAAQQAWTETVAFLHGLR